MNDPFIWVIFGLCVISGLTIGRAITGKLNMYTEEKWLACGVIIMLLVFTIGVI